MPNQNTISRTEAARILGATYGDIVRMQKDGRLPTSRKGRSVFTTRAAVERVAGGTGADTPASAASGDGKEFVAVPKDLWDALSGAVHREDELLQEAQGHSMTLAIAS